MTFVVGFNNLAKSVPFSSGMSPNTVWSCGSSTNVEPELDPEPEETLSINESFFNSAALVSFTTVNCTLENGSATTCYEMVFTSNPVENGPYCPSIIDEIGGVGIYDGNTNPGFQVLKRSLWEAMEADGFDIVDEEGNITIVDPSAGGVGGGPPAGGPGGDDAAGDDNAAGGVTSACLEATPDDELLLTFLIPVTPELLSTPDVIESIENIGISIDGIPLTGDPPSATMSVGGMPGGGGTIPSIDPCGGHMDPSGYYHLHFVAEEMNNVYEARGITEVSCSNFTQSETALVGFAKDGFPIYASKDSNGELPTDLDECNGHVGPTPEFPNGIYHYHASSTSALNLPPCLVGVSVRNSFSFASTNAGGEGIEDTGDTGGPDTSTGEVTDVDPALFLADGTNLTVTLIPCTLSDGTETNCYEIVTNSTPTDHAMGPWCPDNISDDASDGGIWLENGEVFDVDGAFIENMATFYNDDTWMMYDANGDIFITDTEEDCINAANPNVGDAYQNFCVECLPAYITDLSQTWTIPVTPVIQDEFAFLIQDLVVQIHFRLLVVLP